MLRRVAAVLGAAVLAVVGAVAVVAAPAVAAPPGTNVLSWGNNTYGQLGDGTHTARRVPGQVVLPDGVTVTELSSGVQHSLALTSTGQVYSWGRNNYGQLGDGTNTERTEPVLVDLPSGTVVTDVVAGNWHSLALTSTGEVYAWGLSHTNYGSTPTEITTFPGGITIVAVAGGHDFDYVITASGGLYAWGNNNYGQLGDGTTMSRTTPAPVNLPAGTTVTAAEGGWFHGMALTSTGDVYTWGRNNEGQLGDGTLTNRSTPVRALLPAGVTATGISAANLDSLAWTSTEVYTWGNNAYGQLGDGTTTRRTSPVTVDLPAGITVTEVVSGTGAHSVALTATGDVYAWGWNSSGQLGDGTITNRSTPVEVQMPLDAVSTGALATGESFTVAVVNYRPGLGWGYNSAGQVGDGTTLNRNTPVFTSEPDDTVLTSIGAGYLHSLAAGDDGTVYTWGDNTYGQLGTGDTTARSTPTAISLPAGEHAVAVEGGQFHSLALTDDGDVFAWGRNNSGQLGTGDTVQHLTPVQVTFPAGTEVTAIATSNVHNIAVASDGDVYTWGDNSSGQLGDGTTVTRRSPTLITLPGGDVAENVAAGAFHTLAMTNGGTAYAWGANSSGQLGTGNNTNVNVPTAVQLGATTITDIDAGLNHSLAVTDDGGAITWGAGTVGQLGNGGATNSNTPVTVNLPTGVTVNDLTAGQSHSLAVVDISTNPNIEPGRILAWGLNNFGQLGDGTTTARTTPVATHQPAGTIAIEVAGGQFHSIARLTH